MKKNIIILTITIIGLLTGFQNIFAEDIDPHKEFPSDIAGELIVVWPRIVSRGATTSLPVELRQSINKIAVNFNSTLGYVDIVVKNAAGNTVYSNNVNALAGTTIELPKPASGQYNIVITTSVRKTVVTDAIFEIE